MNANTQERITQFDKGTPEALKPILEGLRKAGRQHRVRICLGDPDTGEDWNEENDVTGYIGRSTGIKPCLLLIPNARSTGGGALLTARIVRLVDISTGQELYRNPKYHTAEFKACEGYLEGHPELKAEVWKYAQGKAPELVARCKDLLQAHRLAAFLEGKRHAK